MTSSNQPQKGSAYGPWQYLSELSTLSRTSAQAYIQPEKFKSLTLDIDQFQTGLKAGQLEIAVPTPEGIFSRFTIVESSVMASGLADRYSNIKTYRGQGLDDPAATLRFDITPNGFHGQVLTPSGAYYIDPYYHLDDSTYISYFAKDNAGDRESIEPEDHDHDHNHHTTHSEHSENLESTLATSAASTGAELRTYRLAVAATAEYTNFHGGTIEAAQAAIVTAINRVTGIYETELSIRLELIEDNDLLIYTDPETDPYTNNDPFALLDENQSNIDNIIGSNNYDIGHVLSTEGGGLASLGVIGLDAFKAEGYTGLENPVGDSFYVDLLAHEIGHQFGGNHTFNGDSGACDDNREASAAYEPGSGSTIMSYAGLCEDDALQNNSDPHFHSISFDEIIDRVDNIVPTIGIRTPTGNSVPTVNAGTNFFIPAATPFTLSAVGADTDSGDILTYSWEQRDLGPQQDVNAGDNGESPLFRVFSPTADPSRTFPRLSDLLSNTTVIGETLPTTNRDLNFRAVVRDNRSGGGGVSSDDVVVTVVDTGAPFQVNDPVGSWAANNTETITWDVAGTAGNGIDADFVNILLSIDGGNTFSTVLAENTPNDGTQQISVPDLQTAIARIKVESTNNPQHSFFDVSNINFAIGDVVQSNDDFSNRFILTTSATGSNVGFTGEAEEPNQNGETNSAWWSWTAPVTDEVTINTFGSTFDTYLSVFTGNAVNNLTLIAENDDSIGTQSAVSFSAVAGTTYQIAVDGFESAQGEITLNVSAPELTANVFDVISDHILLGQTDITFELENQGTADFENPEFNIIYSDDDILGNSDDQLITVVDLTDTIIAGGIVSGTIPDIQLPLDILNSRSLAEDPANQETGYISDNIDYLALTDTTGNLLALDDITYFPWDIDGNGLVTPTDAIFIINRLGQTTTPANALADIDGSGQITPTDAIASINRLGYAINSTVFE